MNKEIEACIGALKAIELIRSAYASTAKGTELTESVATMLAFQRSEMGQYGGICQQVSDAIYRGFLNREPPSSAS